MTEHGGHHRMIHRHIGARPIEMRNATQERKALLIEATTCEGSSGGFFDLQPMRGFITKPPRHHARRAASPSTVRKSLLRCPT